MRAPAVGNLDSGGKDAKITILDMLRAYVSDAVNMRPVAVRLDRAAEETCPVR